jgi:hypothetical protein
MEGFLAIILICSRALAPEACDERAALEVRSVRVSNELGCSTGWQEIIARSPERDEVGETTYLKTLCRRRKPAETGRG